MIATETNFKINQSHNSFTHKIYWLNKLSGELPITKIETDYSRPLDFVAKNEFLQFELPITLSKKIINLANNSNLAIYAILLACFKILLSKYTDNPEIIISSPSYHQPGLIANNSDRLIPLRSTVNHELTFKSFLLEIKNTLIEAYLYQDCNFDQLAKLLNLPEDNNCDRFDLSDITFCLENIHNQAKLAYLNNSLNITCLVDSEKISGKISYSSLLFQKHTIKSFCNTFLNIIQQVMNNIQIRISDITFLNPKEQAEILEKFNNNTGNYPVTKSIQELFAQQVQQTPDKIAVVDEQTSLSYQELNKKANQIARLLFNLGVKPGEFIGIAKKRDINFLIAMVAVLKVGGVYVPIDDTYPVERIEYVLSDSQVRVLFTDSDQIKIILNSNKFYDHLEYLICLDSQSETKLADLTIFGSQSFANLSTDNLEIEQTGSDPAYMIYTSGSTGLPKGTIIRHGGAINHIYAQLEALNLSQDLAFLQSAPASSDISVWQFLAPILIGGQTVIVNTETVCNPEQLLQVIQKNEITLVELVPMVLRSLLEYLTSLEKKQPKLPSLQWMMVTGESVSVDLVNGWLKLYSTIPVVNAYGPTEAADDIMQEIIEQPLPKNQRSVLIGKPLANLNVYILDRNLQLLPIGVPGEICVSGYGVGVGYWQNEAKTKASFLLNPFPQNAKPLPGVKEDLLYKTGDLGRWLPQGKIEYLGRIDNQVKIRGFRIELGEIETVLRQYPAIGESVVVIREDSLNEKYIVAYLVADQGEQSELKRELKSKLLSLLKKKLPQYMIPSAFVFLEKLPLTPNGKVDRRALPAPETSNCDRQNEFIPPRTPNEKIVADIWCQILKREKIGIDDNFFELGGHSLVATQIISQLREAFKIELPLRSLFEELTVAGMVEYIEKIQTVHVQQLQTVTTIEVTEEREEIEL
jgi:amino acid adenylation domain-containing protein